MVTINVYILGKPRGKMDTDQLKNLEGKKITDRELDAIYFYLDMNYNSMTQEEISFWIEMLEKIDPNFYED